MIVTELIVQVLSAIFFFSSGLYFLVSGRLKSTNCLENRMRKIGGWLLVGLGIFITLPVFILPHVKAWQMGKIVVLGMATIICLFSGVINLTHRNRSAMDPGSREAAKVVGIFLLISAMFSGLLLIVAMS